MRFEHSLEIERPPEDVYALLADVERVPEWQDDVESVVRESETRFRDTRTFMGRRAETTVEVVVAEPGREFAIRSVGGPVGFAVRHSLEPAGEGRTRLGVTAEADVAGGLAFAARFARRAVERRLRHDYARLKAMLEAA